MFNSILQWAIKQILNGNSAVGTFVLHAIGDKTCTVIGLVLGYLVAFKADFSSFLPAQDATIFASVLGGLVTFFGAYVATPGKAASLVGKIKAATQPPAAISTN